MTLPSLVTGIYMTALVSILYEPVRTSLHQLGQDVGGVGGVGGLTNQWGPSANCTTTLGGTSAPWCFQPGWLGFTPFAAVILTLCTAPLALSAFATHCDVLRRDDKQVQPPRNHMFDSSPDVGFVNTFFAAWIAATMLWFLVPLAAYLASPFFQTDGWHVICAVAISAAFPLSWHMSFVAIPTSAAPFLVPLLGISHDTFKMCHVRIAWSTAGWAAVHVTGEVVYLISQGTFVSSLSLTSPDAEWDDSMLFVCGLMTALMFVAHAVLARLRHRPMIRATFRTYHGAFAAALLLSASAHWWPFVFFLAPAVACTATGHAVRASHLSDAGLRGAPLALVCALVGAVVGITIMWASRQTFMMAHRNDFQTPFVFPPAALVLGYLCARVAAELAIARLPHRTPLLQTVPMNRAVEDDNCSVELTPLLSKDEIRQQPMHRLNNHLYE